MANDRIPMSQSELERADSLRATTLSQEDLVIERLLKMDESPYAEEMEGSPYSRMTPELQSKYNKLAFEFYAPQYINRDKAKFGRMNFKQYTEGLTPGEKFITELGRMEADDLTETDATRWNQIFAEDTEQMSSAAIQYLLDNPDISGDEYIK